MKKTIAPSQTQTTQELTKFNLANYADQLSGIALKEKKERETIYIYPADFGKPEIGGEKGKKHRNKLRNQMKRHSNNILVYAKSQDLEKLTKEIAEFETFYTANYRTHDFTLASISQSNDETKEKDLTLMMKIITDYKNQK